MKRITYLTFTLLLTVFVLSSCKKDTPLEEDQFSGAQLRAGTWTVNRVEQNTYENGALAESDVILFGESEEGGICTFAYDENGNWRMNDNGNVFDIPYELEDNIITTEGGGLWGIREMSENYLEMALRGTTNSNPCNYSSTGSVYYLTRGTR